MRRLKAVAFIAALAGSLLASVPHAEAAIFGTKILIAPPVGETYAKLQCGWHLSCVSPYPWGTGLDWNDNNGTQPESPYVTFRGRAITVSPPYVPFYIGYLRLVWWLNPNYGDCNEVLGQIYRGVDNTLVAKLRYLHTKRWDTKIIPLFGGTDWYRNETTASKMVDDSAGTCSWSGTHVHAWHSAYSPGVVVLNSSIPNAPSSVVYSSPTTRWERYIWYPDN